MLLAYSILTRIQPNLPFVVHMASARLLAAAATTAVVVPSSDSSLPVKSSINMPRSLSGISSEKGINARVHKTLWSHASCSLALFLEPVKAITDFFYGE